MLDMRQQTLLSNNEIQIPKSKKGKKEMTREGRKQLFCVVAALFMMFIAVAIAKGDDKAISIEPEYQLDFTIRFNEIPASQIIKIIQKVMTDNKDACKVEIKIKKPESDFIILDTSPRTTSIE